MVLKHCYCLYIRIELTIQAKEISQVYIKFLTIKAKQWHSSSHYLKIVICVWLKIFNYKFGMIQR